ncbi:MFS transporter [Mycolicibacterium sp. BiH015]|uniref:MFS transporter n=1 Tax=Mycolicibacterium sp. BiH015 TaxID=3018808 RepID=UPI0022E49553|nr:MFS transporter [Mycolicibacterium sp. BiH015]MDA2892127.1 MFS transporter [Mycolicibacterium sp. BiH015]
MHEKAFAAQCVAEESRHLAAAPEKNVKLTLLALALGTFAIGSGEFGSNGVIQLLSAGLDVPLPTATYAVTAYAVGVMIGSPLITVAAARLNRRTLLLALIALFVFGNLFSAVAQNIEMLIAARFLTGTVQGAYFGAGAVVAAHAYGPGRSGKAFATVMAGLTIATIVGSPAGTFIGQQFGWQMFYFAVAVIGLLAGLALVLWVPRTSALDGGPIVGELSALNRPMVWVVSAVAALGIASIFAVYTFIGPFLTDAVGADESLIPVALAVFGFGMAIGNQVGGRLADRHRYRGLVMGYVGALVSCAAIPLVGANFYALMVCLFGVGATTMSAIPTIQVLLTSYGPEGPTLMGSLNLAALNLANALGAVGGSITLTAGFGVLSTAWAGVLLTAAALTLFAITVPKNPPPPAPTSTAINVEERSDDRPH